MLDGRKKATLKHADRFPKLIDQNFLRGDVVTPAQLISFAFLNTAIIVTPTFAQDSGSAYRERYQIAGELARATAVCANSEAEAKWFLKGGLDAIKSPELRAFTKSFKETATDWMKSGGEAFNRKVMSDGIPAACAFARSEHDRALQLASEPITPTASHNDDRDLGGKTYDVDLKGTCNFKMLSRDQFGACDPSVTFTNYTNHRSSYEFTGNNGTAVFVFEGGHERQPDLENYFLKVDKIKIGTVTNGKVEGMQGAGEGECHMRLNKDASQFYEVKCDVYDRKARIVYNFSLILITRFQKHNY